MSDDKDDQVNFDDDYWPITTLQKVRPCFTSTCTLANLARFVQAGNRTKVSDSWPETCASFQPLCRAHPRPRCRYVDLPVAALFKDLMISGRPLLPPL